MSGLFDPENTFWAFLTKLYTLAYVGFLWFVFSLPIITIGASTTALYAYTCDVVNKTEGYVWKTFYSVFKANFVKATKLWLFIVFFGLFLYFDAVLCLKMSSLVGKILFFGVISFVFIFSLTVIYIFPLLAYKELPIKELVRSSFVMSMGSLPISITLVVVQALFLILFYYFPLTLLFSNGFLAIVQSLLLFPLFKKVLGSIEK